MAELKEKISALRPGYDYDEFHDVVRFSLPSIKQSLNKTDEMLDIKYLEVPLCSGKPETWLFCGGLSLQMTHLTNNGAFFLER